MKKIAKISVTNLFGLFNHTVSLKTDERVTIIHSPNGFGKTVILNIIDEIFTGGNRVLRTTPFDEFRITFEDKSQLWVTREVEDDNSKSGQIGSVSKLTFHFQDPDTAEQKFTRTPLLAQALRTFLPAVAYTRLVQELNFISLGAFTEESLSVEDIVERYGQTTISGMPVPYEEDPEWLQTIRKSISVRLIETLRLLSSKPNEISRTVTMYPKELAETIKTKLAESTALSQFLDGTFPRRVISSMEKQRNISEEELRNQLTELQTKRANLMAVGIIDKDDNEAVQTNVAINANTKAALSVYVEDLQQKLGVFDDIANKIELFKRIINERFLYKEMAICRKEGFVFTTQCGTRLPLENLSSGEQHELVLFYELLFKASPSTLLLIDEPEMSLHVVRQEQFLKDVQEITRFANIDVIIATHSPDIISEQRDLVVWLEGPLVKS